VIERERLMEAIPDCLKASDLAVGVKYTGKVRDTYDLGDGRLVLVTTDRQSGFDRMLGAIPFKGQVLNRTSLYWFEATKGIIGNHVLGSPHANAVMGKKCRVLPIEFVVRGYLTGSTDTSIWSLYQKGGRSFSDVVLEDGLKKNAQLPKNIVTPTTKEKEHDRPITAAEIVAEGWMTSTEWEFASAKALELFAFGQKVAAERGLILVDTKYEFGVADDGEILLIDEIHTPDSSRYWIAESYESRVAEGREPDMIDKEFFRLWFRDRCDPYKDAELPVPPDELIAELASRYIQLFERITGMEFEPDLRPLEETLMVAVKA
jgi:phosphoribosylaminoimidazole-succinocarboxamide synthase